MMQNKPGLIIIGAGAAGLSAGIYAQKNGFTSQILEMHSIPGGLCTSWKRKGYTFDGAVRFLASCHQGGAPHPLWQELGLFSATKFIFYDEFICFEGRDGRKLHFYTDTDRFERHLLELSPPDKALITEFTDGIRGFSPMQLPIDMTAANGMEMAEIGRDMLPVLIPTLKWINTTLQAFASRFKDPLLREGIPHFFQFSPPDFPMMLCLSTLASLNDHEFGYPVGGSLPIAQELEKRYLELGGHISYRSRVTSVLTENDQAVGVRLENGQELKAQWVINAGDGHAAIYELLEGRYIDGKLAAIYQGDMNPSKSIIQVSLGVSQDWSTQPPAISFPLPEPIWIGNLHQDRLVVKHYSFDPTLARSGRSALSVWIEADYDYWKWLRSDRKRYQAHKDEVAELVISALDQRFPGFRAAVEVVDVATPVTYERYTGNWRGAFAGWAMSKAKMSMIMGKGMPKTLSGLQNFMMCGQWVEPGGNVELSCASGRDVIKDICGEIKIPFLV